MQGRHRNQFGFFLNEQGLLGNGIEIGVAEGNYSEKLLKSSNLRKLYLLDTWEVSMSGMNADPYGEARYKRVIKKMKEYGDRVEIIRGNSLVEFNRFPDCHFDFIYLDANHEYEYIKLDLKNWYPKCKDNGVFSGHDYFNGMTKRGMCGVKQAVDEFCLSINTVPIITFGTEKCPPSWYLIKGKM
jgi:hypothetical protein